MRLEEYTIRGITQEQYARYIWEIASHWECIRCPVRLSHFHIGGIICELLASPEMLIKAAHISVSPEHLERYAKKFEYGFNHRVRPDVKLSEFLLRFPEMDA